MGIIQQMARGVSGAIGRNSPLIIALRPAYEGLLATSAGNRGIDWRINGVPFRIDPHYRIEMAERYDEPVAAYFREHVKPGSVFFDVGANVGVYVLQFSHWAGPTGRVIAFEPSAATRDVLKLHIVMNKLDGRVEVVPAAVGSELGEATLYASGASGMSRLGAPNPSLTSTITPIQVPIVTLDSFVKDRNWELLPDWILLDIEGFEISALRGAFELLTQKKPSCRIVVEMHPSVWSSANTDEALAIDTFAKLGRRVVPLTGQKDPLRDHGLVALEPLM